MGLLLPAISAARDGANRVLCGGALRQWGLALTAYASDNHGIIPRTPGYDWPAAANWSLDADDAGSFPNQFSVNRIIEYMPGARFENGRWYFSTGLYLCPCQKGMQTMGHWGASTTWTTYGYFGWAQSWPAWGNGPWSGAVSPLGRQMLTDKRMQTEQIVMMDLVVDHGSGRGGFHANHLRGGGNFGPATRLGGGNQLWGDGRVVWKNGEAFGPQGILDGSGLNYASTLPPGWGDVYWF